MLLTRPARTWISQVSSTPQKPLATTLNGSRTSRFPNLRVGKFERLGPPCFGPPRARGRILLRWTLLERRAHGLRPPAGGVLPALHGQPPWLGSSENHSVETASLRASSTLLSRSSLAMALPLK